MLQIKNICKQYTTGTLTQKALDNVSLTLRDNEFVAILGPSGSGKTTLLNVIGGLDRYDSGDLIINGISTKQYKDRDWDSYRNHTIGFVFQSYNLIPHQSILSNVELALTISGVSKGERRKRATQALEKVGLGNQLHKKPNQMSGGQMQRVAIARALVNDPDILLADEPTGALDTETSIQVMDLLKEVAKDRLVVMVTHNPELAETYATRIVNLRDGQIKGDSNPYMVDEKTQKAPEHKTMGKSSMSLLTSLSLSFNNLRTKKGRTVLTAFAGSIGIIGIALILSLSNGVNNYIDNIQSDTMSSYPVTLESSSMDMTVMMEAMMGIREDDGTAADEGTILSTPVITDVMETMFSKQSSNDLAAFKEYLESGESGIEEYSTAIQYGYNLDLMVYNENGVGGPVQVNPNQILEKMGFGEMTELQALMGTDAMVSSAVWQELTGGRELWDEQYELLAGNWPQAYNEVVLQVDENGTISDYTLFSLGLMDQDILLDNFEALMSGEEMEAVEQQTYTYEEILGTTFKLLLNTDYYEKENGIWVDKSNDEDYMNQVLADAAEIKIVGITAPAESTVSSTSITGGVGYTHALQEYVIEHVNESEIAKEQISKPEINVFTGMEFDGAEFDFDSLSDEEKAQFAALSDEEKAELMAAYQNNSQTTYESNLALLGVVDLDSPSSISIYPRDFDSKDAITDIIDAYNDAETDAGREENVITYSDIMGTMMESVTSIINIISYVLIAFVSVSLVVSSIMIGIITFISVMERTKEIGILRAIGASKRNISQVFNAETLIIGLFSGVMGVGISMLLTIPINAVIHHLIGSAMVSAALPVSSAVILVVLSVILTLIGGFIPARKAAKKDPVTALRTE